MPSHNCLFCKIVRREIPSTVVCETDDVLAFRDIAPQAPSHVLIIPKRHYETLLDVPVDEGLFDRLFAVAKEVARLEGLEEKGFRTVFNCREWGGQIVYHVHLHVLGGRRLSGGLG